MVHRRSISSSGLLCSVAPSLRASIVQLDHAVGTGSKVRVVGGHDHGDTFHGGEVHEQIRDDRLGPMVSSGWA